MRVEERDEMAPQAARRLSKADRRLQLLETALLNRVLAPVVQRFPKLKVVFEHVTTREAVQFVTSSRPGVAMELRRRKAWAWWP